MKELKDELNEAVKLCDKFIFGRGDPLHDKNLHITDIFNQYRNQFLEALAILDAMDFDPTNEKGTFFHVAHQIVEQTAARSQREGVPMLVTENVDPEIFKVIEVFNKLLKQCFDNLKIELFSISLSVPWASFDAWLHPIKFLVCNRTEANELRKKTREMVQK